MAFGNGAFMQIWGVVPKGKYFEVEVSSSRKNNTTGNYETDFSSKSVRFIGTAATKNPQAGQKIKVTNCSVQNCYEKDGRREYLKSPTYLVFDYELQTPNGNAPASAPAYNPYGGTTPSANPLGNEFEPLAMDDEEGLPF